MIPASHASRRACAGADPGRRCPGMRHARPPSRVSRRIVTTTVAETPPDGGEVVGGVALDPLDERPPEPGVQRPRSSVGRSRPHRGVRWRWCLGAAIAISCLRNISAAGGGQGEPAGRGAVAVVAQREGDLPGGGGFLVGQGLGLGGLADLGGDDVEDPPTEQLAAAFASWSLASDQQVLDRTGLQHRGCLGVAGRSSGAGDGLDRVHDHPRLVDVHLPVGAARPARARRARRSGAVPRRVSRLASGRVKQRPPGPPLAGVPRPDRIPEAAVVGLPDRRRHRAGRPVGQPGRRRRPTGSGPRRTALVRRDREQGVVRRLQPLRARRTAPGTAPPGPGRHASPRDRSLIDTALRRLDRTGDGPGMQAGGRLTESEREDYRATHQSYACSTLDGRS